MWMSCGSEWPSSTMIFLVHLIHVGYLWSPAGKRMGSAGVRMSSACLTRARASGWKVRSSAT